MIGIFRSENWIISKKSFTISWDKFHKILIRNFIAKGEGFSINLKIHVLGLGLGIYPILLDINFIRHKYDLK